MRAARNVTDVTTELLTLQMVAKSEIGFVIPSYQRPYVWSEDDVIKLFDDIKAAYISSESQYFIGSVLSAIRLDDGIEVLELIDGQQRTTSLILISLAFKASDVEAPISEVSILNKQPRLNFEIRSSVYNLIGSYAGLEMMTKPGPQSIQNDAYLKHLDANLSVLKQQVSTLQKDTSFDLQAFADYLFTKVSWVNNIVPESMDLNRLFTSMNTAGIQLEPVDLLKAKLFRKITSDKALYSTIWQACEHTENYFERNLRQLFPMADWNALEYKDLWKYSPELFGYEEHIELKISNKPKGKTLAMLFDEVTAGDAPENVVEPKVEDSQTDLDDETVYCRSIVGFELLLIHALRIFCAQQGWPDLEPRIKAGNLMACFETFIEHNEKTIKAFIELLWRVRYQFDTWVVKWVEHDDRNDPQLRLTTISRSLSSGKYYINRTARELGELVQLQAVRNFTGDRSAQYWLTALLGRLVVNPSVDWSQVLTTLEEIDNYLSLITETQKEASFKIAKGQSPDIDSWENQMAYFYESRGTAFEHYWFQKLEYLLWKHGDKTDEKLKRYRITSKNSIEHVHPQNEEYKKQMAKESLDAFGNLVLLSPGENSSYSNQTVLKKHADFQSKPRYDSLKLKVLFEAYENSGREWGIEEIAKHQSGMLEVLRMHYQSLGLICTLEYGI